MMVPGAVISTSIRHVLVQADVTHDLSWWCSMLTQIGIVMQNLIQLLGGACSSCPLLRVVVLVIALGVIDTGSNLTVVVMDNSKLFSSLQQCLLSTMCSSECLA